MPSNRDLDEIAEKVCEPLRDSPYLFSRMQVKMLANVKAALVGERNETRKQTENSIKEWAEKFIAIFAKALEDIENLGNPDFQPCEYVCPECNSKNHFHTEMCSRPHEETEKEG